MSETPIQTTTLRPGEDTFQRLRKELGVSSFGINLITLEPRQRLRVHLHEHQEEVYLVLEGELTLLVEGEPHPLPAGSLARVGPAVRRQLTNPAAEPALILALGGSGEHEGRDALAWSDWDQGGEGGRPQDVPLPPPLPED